LPILGFALRAEHGERESTTKEVGVYQDEKLFAALQKGRAAMADYAEAEEPFESNQWRNTEQAVGSSRSKPFTISRLQESV